MEYRRNFEAVNKWVARLPVPGGWIVTIFPSDGKNEKAGMKTLFIKDETHNWMLEDMK